jgi:serine/threonine protein phosphatase PrpC
MQSKDLEKQPSSRLRYSVLSDVGSVRTENQDSFGIINHGYIQIFVVADGMGGVQGGKIASTMAVELLTSQVTTISELSISALQSLILDVHRQIYERSQIEANLSGMGTTLVGLAFDKEKVFFFNVGDSRLYYLKNGEISQLTTDHTVVNELLHSGAITEEQASNHPVSHMLTRSLGASPDLLVDCIEYTKKLEVGDRFLLCSDGLHGLVGDQDLLKVSEANSQEKAVANLIALANEKGGKDNITSLIVEVCNSSPNKEPISSKDSTNTSVPKSQVLKSSPQSLLLVLGTGLLVLAAIIIFFRQGSAPLQEASAPVLDQASQVALSVDDLIDPTTESVTNSESKIESEIVKEVTADQQIESVIDTGQQNLARYLDSQRAQLLRLENQLKYFSMSKEMLLDENARISSEHLAAKAKFNQIDPQIAASKKLELQLNESFSKLNQTDHLSSAKALVEVLPNLNNYIEIFNRATAEYIELVEQRAFMEADPAFQAKFKDSLHKRNTSSAELKKVLELELQSGIAQQKLKQTQLSAELEISEKLSNDLEHEMEDLGIVIKEIDSLIEQDAIQARVSELTEKISQIKSNIAS